MSTANDTLLTPDNEQFVAKYLTELAETNPDTLPYGLFVPLAKLMVINTVEIAYVKPEKGSLSVLLTQRPANDKFWANQWHIPGSIVRASDPIEHEHDFDAVIHRVAEEVCGGIMPVAAPHVYDVVRRRGARGPETTTRLYVPTEGTPNNGGFFDAHSVLENPPDGGLLESHPEAIKALVEYHQSLIA